MDPTKRKTIIAGNWKMNVTPNKTLDLVNEIGKQLMGFRYKCEVVLCVPYVDIAYAMMAGSALDIKAGAQNVHWAEKGAFTGEISAEMLTDFGAKYVIVGHSERRQYFGDTDETVNMRLLAGLNGGLKVILCVGETLDEREGGITTQTVLRQTREALKGVTPEMLKNVVIAYEPVWAIGTGRTATADQAEEVCEFIREVIANLFSRDDAEALTILYGGSMNAGNAAELLSKKNVDGGLIGGASLKPEDFAKIVEATNQ